MGKDTDIRESGGWRDAYTNGRTGTAKWRGGRKSGGRTELGSCSARPRDFGAPTPLCGALWDTKRHDIQLIISSWDGSAVGTAIESNKRQAHERKRTPCVECRLLLRAAKTASLITDLTQIQLRTQQHVLAFIAAT